MSYGHCHNCGRSNSQFKYNGAPMCSTFCMLIHDLNKNPKLKELHQRVGVTKKVQRIESYNRPQE